METTMETLNAYQLARVADVQSPDSLESPGAMFLLAVQQSVTDTIESTSFDPDGSRFDADDEAHRIADECVSVLESHGTYRKWLAFVDLCAWQEDTSDLGTPEDMNQGADWALYAIADRLAAALLESADDAS